MTRMHIWLSKHILCAFGMHKWNKVQYWSECKRCIAIRGY